MLVSVEKPGSPAEVLEHFGKKGMRWGVRNEEKTSSNGKSSQPKTISPRKEKRAKGHTTTANQTQKAIDEIKAKPSSNWYVNHQRNAQVHELEQYRDKHVKAAKDIREGHLTDYQKKVIIGASVVGVTLAAYGTYKFIDSGTAHQMLSKNIPMKKNDLLSRKMSPDSIMKEVVKPINPGYGDLGTKMNCRRCTFAYEMRRRGMDVKATNTVKGTGQMPLSLLKATDPNSHIKTGRYATMKSLVVESLEKDRWGRPAPPGPVTTLMKEGQGLGKRSIGKDMLQHLEKGEKSQWIFDQLAKNPEGARGELGMSWNQGGAHSMAWEIIGGKPVIFDTQSGKAYDAAKFSQEVATNVSKAGYTRLDDIPLNTNFLGKWVRNVK